MERPCPTEARALRWRPTRPCGGQNPAREPRQPPPSLGTPGPGPVEYDTSPSHLPPLTAVCAAVPRGRSLLSLTRFRVLRGEECERIRGGGQGDPRASLPSHTTCRRSGGPEGTRLRAGFQHCPHEAGESRTGHASMPWARTGGAPLAPSRGIREWRAKKRLNAGSTMSFGV